jgi:hypothetical protein
MSLYVEWLSKIKAMSTYEWLTDGQKRAYDQIVGQWQGIPFIALCGASGCGKTFIGHLLAREQGYSYCRSIECVLPHSDQVIVDGNEYSRLMRPAAMLLGLNRVTVLLRRPPKDPIPLTRIFLTEKDVRQFQHNLVKNGVLQTFVSDVQDTDLGQILRAEAIARGQTYVTS